MRRSQFHAVVLTGWLLVGILRASEVNDEDATIDTLLQAYVDSQGGRERLLTITSLEVKGTTTLESQGISVPTIQILQTPDKVYTRQDFPSLGIITNRLNGRRGWEWHPIAGERPLDPAEVEEYLDDTDFERDLRLREEYAGVRLGKPEVIEGIETTQLVFTDDDGKEEYWFFKANGDLFQKIHIVTSGPESEFEATERYYELTMEDGFRFPRRIRYIHPAYEAELVITELVINREVDQSLFELPDYAEELEKLAGD